MSFQIVGYPSAVYDAAHTDLPSTQIWWDAPDLSWLKDHKGHAYWLDDDFNDNGSAAATTLAFWGKGWKAYNAGSGTVTNAAVISSTAVPTGCVQISTDTAGDQGSLCQVCSPFSLAATAKKLWLEARIATTQIVTNDAALLFGLGATSAWTPGAAVPLADANALAAASILIGWHRDEDGLGVLQTGYADSAADYTDVDTTAGTIAALTWTKLGLVYDPSDTTNTIRFYQNGVVCDNVVSAATLAALTYLDATALGVFFAFFADSAGTSSSLYCDWVRCIQLI